MFASPTTWEGLYGHPPSGTNRASNAPPHFQHSAQQQTSERAEQGRQIQANNGYNRDNRHDTDTFLYGHPRNTTELDRAAEYNASRDLGLIRGHAPTFYPSYSPVTAYTVASQPVRVFPPPPSTVTAPTVSWSEAAPSYLPSASGTSPLAHRHGWTSSTAELAYETATTPEGGGPGLYGVPGGDAHSYYQRQYTEGRHVAAGTEYASRCDSRSNHLAAQTATSARRSTAGERRSSGVLPAAYAGLVYALKRSNPSADEASCQPRGMTGRCNNNNDEAQHNTTDLCEGVNTSLDEHGCVYSELSDAAPAAVTAPSRPPTGAPHLFFTSPPEACHDATPTLHERLGLPPETPQCFSISDGACKLNSVPHRSAAAAASAFHLGSSGPSPSSACWGSAAVSRSARSRREGLGSSDSTPHPSGTDPQQHSPFSSATAASTSMTAAGITQTEPCCVAALIFNNAKEVGVALCELPSLTISLLQFADTAAFFKTTSLLHSRNPVEVLVPSTVVNTEFVQTLLRQHGAHMTFTSVQRCFYHTEAGVQRLSKLKSSEEAALCIADTDRYLCVAAANALVLFMEHVNDMQLLPGSVRVRAEALEHFMEVSRTTARALQIISGGSGAGGVLSRCAPLPVWMKDDPPPSRLDGGRAEAKSAPRRRPRSTYSTAAVSSAAAGGTAPLRAEALVDVIPRACTIMGQRYLRRTLLQPLRDRIAVQGRHDAVEWLLRDTRRLHVLRALLRHTAALDLERLTATLTLQPRWERAEAQKQSYLESLLLLWSALPYLERLHTQLSAYLAALPTGGSSATGFPSPSASPAAELPPRRQQQSDGDSSRMKGSDTAVSTPDSPSVLHSVATTLRQCRFAELKALMHRYLESSVLPSVVEHYEHGGANDAERSAGRSRPSFDVRGQRGQADSPANGAALCTRYDRAPHSLASQRAATTTLLRVLRMCFLVQAPPGGELDALRMRLSERITGITTYAEELRQRFQLYSLRLEPDPIKLYCLSYLSSEESKAQAVPFTWRYAGGSHFALYLAALQQQQEQQQQVQQQACGRSLHDGGDSEEVEAQSVGHPSRRRLPSDNLSSSSTMWSSAEGPGRRQGYLAGLRAAATSVYQSTCSPLLTPSWNAEPSMHPIGGPGEGVWRASAPFHLQNDGGKGCNRRRRVRCGTEELEYHCARTQECVAAILEGQMRGVQPLVQAIRQNFLSALQATVESVALLDTLLSFALYSLTHHCTRPVMVELKTGLTTGAQVTQRCPTSLSEEDEMEQHDSGDDSMTLSEATDCPNAFFADSTLASARGRESTSVSTQETPATTADAVAGIEKKRGRRVPFFVEGAFHPSAGVASAPLQAPTQHPCLPGHLSYAAQRTQAGARARGGLSFSWGARSGVGIITGPNACGKTTLLRILGQLITLAQAGCFVPARQAHLFLADRLFAHMLCDELPSVLHSSFKRELMELNELTHGATEESVVLMDELGRSTTTAQGFSLAWAAALFLSNRHVHAVLTTHFTGLPSLMRVLPGRVVAFHFLVSLAQVEVGAGREQHRQQEADNACDDASIMAGDVRMHASTSASAAGQRVMIARFGHELFPGPCPQRWYGLAMAERMNFFEPVLSLAAHTRACALGTSEPACGERETGDTRR
ncbi:putative mis-match repair protein [Leptomonas seymouri]|uniref:Putative mis-match repair protein n=1 Tax=Leptomonas seymouri TaxID=5684 RepID=A0A0N1IM60_LEPSE|nr:putative mis-match repair protein [Leptomonas seymouri]|eukprot:KPI89028.1 putative mis-match repair protein [Leptomonas seymouri]